MVKNAKIEKSDQSFNTYDQYVEDLKFWELATGNAHRLLDKDIVTMFFSGRRYFASRYFPRIRDIGGCDG